MESLLAHALLAMDLTHARAVLRPAYSRSFGFQVNWKTAERRRVYMRKAYPNSREWEPEKLPRKGRVGGWLRDPQLSVHKLDGTNAAHERYSERRSLPVVQAGRGRGDGGTGGTGGGVRVLLRMYAIVWENSECRISAISTAIETSYRLFCSINFL